MPTDRPDVIVVGGGVIGLATAFRLGAAGRSVTVRDSSPGHGASWVAAGMLAPVTEAVFGEEDLTRLCLAAVPAFEHLAATLEAAGSGPVGLSRSGTLAVAFNADDRDALDRLTEYRDSLGLASSRLTGSEARRLDPWLATDVRGGVLVEDDLSVDNRAYVGALRVACEKVGVDFVAETVSSLTDLDAALVVVAAGSATAALTGVPVHPVKGHVVRLRIPEALARQGVALNHTVRGLVRGSDVYLVPRANGEVVVGATSEHRGFDVAVTAGGVYELLRNAYELLPVSSEFDFLEASAGLRPGTPDNGPVVGWLDDRTIVASGHYRNGILLSAVTAEAVEALVTGAELGEEWNAFGPDRFSR
jgi:glycine oxidase